MKISEPEMILFMGIPASGKSSFFGKNFFDSHVRINLDMLKTRNREKMLIEACLKAKQSFVVDNTNVARDDRKSYIQVAKEQGFAVTGYFFESVLKDCLLRNKNREPKKVIPDIAVITKAKKLELPARDEGFDKLFRVKINADAEFEIEEWHKT